MRLSVGEAHQLALGALRSIGCDDDEANATADHLLDDGLRGMTFGSLARVLAISARFEKDARPRSPIRVIHETPVSVLLDGGDHVGYYVAREATSRAIDRANSPADNSSASRWPAPW